MTAPRSLRARLAATAAGLALVTGAIAAGGVKPTTAAWGDSEYTSASVSALALTAPAANGCERSTLVSTQAILNWQAPTNPPEEYFYWWELRDGGPDGTLVSSGRFEADTTQYDIGASGLLGILTTYTFRIQTRVGVHWSSPWRTAAVSTLLRLGDLSVIGTCTWN